MGTKYGKNRDMVYHSQINNIIEQYSKMFGDMELETCGASASATCITSMLGETAFKVGRCGLLPAYYSLDDHIIQVAFYLSGAGGTRKTTTLIEAYKLMYDLAGTVYYNKSLDFIRMEINKGNAVQICLDEPGHYLAAVDVNSDGSLYCWDSWKNRTGDAQVNISETAFHNNVVAEYIVYNKPSVLQMMRLRRLLR